MSKPRKCEMCEINSIIIEDMHDQIASLNDKVISIRPQTLNTEIKQYLTCHDNIFGVPDDVEHKIILSFMLHYMNIKTLINSI